MLQFTFRHSVKKKMTKYQHFVPQFYLGNFVNHCNEVQVLDLKSMRCVNPRGTKRICGMEFFYGVETGVEDAASQIVEDWFQKMESLIGGDLDPFVDKILNNKTIEIKDKWTIALLMSMLWIRGQEMRKQINRMVEETTKWMMEQEYSIHPDKKFDEYDKRIGTTTPPKLREQLKQIIVNKAYEIKSTNAAHINNLNEIPSVANLFYHQHWTVYISECSKHFLTTDNPLVVKFPKANGLRGRTFLERAHYFALTPDIFILATESDDPPEKPGNTD